MRGGLWRVVDLARLPVYLAIYGREIAAEWPLVLAACAGVVLGTALGTRVLARLPDRVFRRIIAVLLLVLGFYVMTAGSR
jgi:uncharacterized membrane protein YfcA